MNRFTPAAHAILQQHHYRTLAHHCKVSPRTAYRWQKGEATADGKAAELLAEFLALRLDEVIAEDRPTIAEFVTPDVRRAAIRTRWINAGKPGPYRRPAYRWTATGHPNVRRKELIGGGVRFVVTHRPPGVTTGPWTRNKSFRTIAEAVRFEAEVNGRG